MLEAVHTEDVAARAAVSVPTARATVAGKFLFLGDRKFYVRGVTYGTFRPDAHGHEFPAPDVVAADFRLMAMNGVNAIRTYTVPPRSLLDEADRHGVRVMVGLGGERYVAYLNDGRSGSEIADLLRPRVRACSNHPAVLCYAVANEIPASIVRWFRPRRIERYIAQLCEGVRREDPQRPVTYVNYPSTEYLQLSFIDVVSFNVYLESPHRLAAYLARLQNIARDRPLLMAEIGLDSIRNGELTQAASLATQVETTFRAGCAGAFVYAWTDEWHRGGEDVDDWAFGITRRDRRPKPALAAVRRSFAATPLPPDLRVPRVSVVVCTFNGARTLRDCLDGLCALDYPDYEVIVVNDGSTDHTPAVVAEYPVRLIATENRGLSCARNTGLAAAAGDIVAYIDDDARPDPHWLQYLVGTFMEGDWAAVGGPNLPPVGDCMVADCVANAPGGPLHVLLSDREAEHVPGCNMAFRRDALLAIGGFDPQFRVAGDDVDICWRIHARGLRIGFSPAAVVWHRRRPSVRAYLSQQKGYGKAEALLERKWPAKYNGARHVVWAGRLYGKALHVGLAGARRWRVYYGSQGSALFQSLYQPATGGAAAVVRMPEWYLVIAILCVLCLFGATWQPLLLVSATLLVAAAGVVVLQAIRSAVRAHVPTASRTRRELLAIRALTALLHMAQPAARLHGRLAHGLQPWRYAVRTRPRLPLRRTWAFWSTRRIDSHARLAALERRLTAAGAMIRRGGEYDRWDVEVQVGVLMRQRLLMCVEEHGGGAQLMRVRAVWRWSVAWCAMAVLFLGLAIAAALDHAPLAATALGVLAAAIVAWGAWESAVGAGTVAEAIEHVDDAATPVRRRDRREPLRA